MNINKNESVFAGIDKQKPPGTGAFGLSQLYNISFEDGDCAFGCILKCLHFRAD